jgi:hypothetical protein
MTYRVIWAQGIYGDVLDFALEGFKDAWTIFAGAVGMLLLLLIGKSRLTRVLYPYSVKLPLAPALLDIWLTVCLIGVGAGLIYWIFAGLAKSDANGERKNHKFALWASIAFCVSYGYWLFAHFIGRAFMALERLLEHYSAAWLMEGLILVLLLGLGVLLLYLTIQIVGRVWRWATRQFYVAVRMEPDVFRADMRRFSSEEQAQLLSIATPATLRIAPGDFVDLLIEIEKDVKDGPAAEKYWTKRAELQDLVRHERNL